MTKYDFESKCKHCDEDISSLSKLCHHCGKHQNGFSFYLDRYSTIIRFSIIPLIAVLAVSLTYLQYKQSKVERIRAEEAAKRAEQSLSLSVESLKYTEKILESSMQKIVRWDGDMSVNDANQLITDIEYLLDKSKEYQHETD